MSFSALVTFVLALRLLTPAVAAPAPPPAAQYPVPDIGAPSGYWLGSIERNGKAPFGGGGGEGAGYQLFRNVKDFGAVGDGAADDTEAISQAILSGNRCGDGCDSSTTTPALVYFPAGTYKVSKPIVMYYYSQLVGDALNPPTLLAAPEFKGMAVLDADPYRDDGTNWFTNQNNFFRQVRNFVIDLRQMPPGRGAGIHWQVAQATSLQNIRFEMHVDPSEQNKQIGIFMDNGSGGFMADLTFNGGQYGAFFGSQQFTTRNLTFNGCRTAVFMNWNWAWTLQDLHINNCGVGVDMANGGEFQTVGSVMLLDSVVANTPIGVATSYSTASAFTNGSLVIENTDMSLNVRHAVANTIDPAAPVTVLPGNQKVDSFVQGRVYDASGAGKAVQGPATTPITKPAGLVGADGKVVTRSKPQYENVPASSFVSVKKAGAVGDGVADDSDAIQRVFDAATPEQVVYFDHGAYLVTKTINVPKNIRITGEIWPLIMAGGTTTFKDENNPQPMFRVGRAGDVGDVEISELIIETQGPQPGAILVEWNVEAKTPGSAGLWDTHFRIGGSAGTQLQSDRCSKAPGSAAAPNPECIGAFLLMHITASASAYLENVWFWVSDHELDLGDHSQINIYNGRGILIESTKPTWLWGTASEHSVLYNYQVTNAKNVWLSMVQTETAYFQGNPDARTPFAVQEKFSDPNWDALCAGHGVNCARTLGIRVTASSDVYLYGGGLYSFFSNYEQECLATADCQQDMVYVEKSSNVHMLGISTKAATNMIKVDNRPVALDADNRNNFCAMIAQLSL